MSRDTAIGAAVRAMAAQRRQQQLEQAAEPVEQPPAKRKRRKLSTGEKHVARRSTSVLPAEQK